MQNLISTTQTDTGSAKSGYSAQGALQLSKFHLNFSLTGCWTGLENIQYDKVFPAHHLGLGERQLTAQELKPCYLVRAHPNKKSDCTTFQCYYFIGSKSQSND